MAKQTLRAGRGPAPLDTETMLHLVTVDNLFTGEIVRQYCFIGDEESCIMNCQDFYDTWVHPFHIQPYRKLVDKWPQN